MSAMAGPRVVILEDQALMRQSVRELLHRAGFDVVGDFADLATFHDAFDGLHPSIAIVDLGLEPAFCGDGAEMVRQLHLRYPDLYMLVFSGTTDTALIDRCRVYGASAFLHKASTGRAALLAAVEAAARGEAMWSVPLETDRPDDPVLRALSRREREVLRYIAAGADNLKIASHLEIAERTVKAHVSALYRKLGSENRTHLALLALHRGLRPPPEV